MTTPVVLLSAMLLDAIWGEPRWLWSRVPHPAVLMGRAVSALEVKLNRGTQRRAKGLLCTVALVVISGLAGILLSLGGPLVESLCVAVLLAHRSLVDHVAAVATGLRTDLSHGRSAVAMIVSRDTSAMDDSAAARAAIESAAENLSDGVIAPAFWFLLGGLPAMAIYKCINTADSMIGYRTARYLEFGWAAARADDLLNLIPARLTAGLLAVAAGGLEMSRLLRDAHLHRSPNAGWPEAAMAQALDIALAGPRSYDGEMRQLAWVNGGAREVLSPNDIDASISMLWKAWGLMFALCACLGFVIR